MARDDFQRDMGEYLRTRKRAGFNIKTFIQDFLPKKRPEAEMPEEVEVYHADDKPKPKKENRLKKWFNKQEPPTEELLRTQMQAEDAITDLKEMAKITLGIVKQLPDEQLREIKQSSDFERMKTLLKKHELIK